ncbi:MAG: hypothetical protein TREMPRED_003524 [Tremellales sp. Tagirdzhanova-0007]|nr:MAG: hypothetical protein TREMPRED_003524 [Tremellales sp. Tagirdzhanova-0007]
MSYDHPTLYPHTHSLPPRPNFQTNPGPSLQSSYQARQQPQQPQYPPQIAFNPYYNVTGGYQPYSLPGHPYFLTQNHGQSFFPTQPVVTPEGYSYSSTYVQQPQHAPAPPAKRQRLDIPGSRTGGGVKAWRNCSYPGCKYVGPGEEVEVHEGDRHLIFPNGRNPERSEEEERYAKQKRPLAVIEGTGIVLKTKEDIEDWVANRRANWPTANRIVEKEQQRQAAVARGEIPREQNRRGRGGRGSDPRRPDPAAQAEDWGRVVTVKSRLDGSDIQPRGRGRGRRGQERRRGGGRGREAGRGRGREVRDGDSRAQDLGVSSPTSPDPSVIHHNIEVSAVPPTQLTVLGGYESTAPSSARTSDSDSTSDSTSSDSNEADRTAHDTSTTERGGEKAELLMRKRRHTKQTRAKRVNPFLRPSMLGALLANPIRNTLSQLSQTIRFLVANDLLEGVELRPGEADERKNEEQKVTIVDEISTAT